MAIVRDLEGLDPKEVVDVQRENGSASESLPDSRKLSVAIRGAEPRSTIGVFYGDTSHPGMTITLERTVRVPDNDATNSLPPSLGHFPLFRVRDYVEKLPADMAAKGGLFFPMYQREAMWVNFSATIPFALKMYVGGVNAVSGLPMVENEQTKEKRRRMLEEKKDIQDYMVLPSQPWIDGIVCEDGAIRQFVAKPKGSGFSVEAQVTGEEKVGGIQFEIIPLRKEFPASLKVKFSEDGGDTRKLEIDFAAHGVTEATTWADIKSIIAKEMGKADSIKSTMTLGVSEHNWTQISCNDNVRLGEVIFHPDLIIEADISRTDTRAMRYFGTRGVGMVAEEAGKGGTYNALSSALIGCAPVPQMTGYGGGVEGMSMSLFGSPGMSGQYDEAVVPSMDTRSCNDEEADDFAVSEILPVQASLKPKKKKKVKEMGIAAGGSIRQTIKPDTFPASVWDPAASVLLNVQILDSEDFCEVTGRPKPWTPVDAATYAKHGYPFFTMWNEENTGIRGDFGEVKSVAQIEKERAAERGETLAEEKSVDVRVVGLDMGGFTSTFCPLEEMRKGLGMLSLTE